MQLLGLIGIVFILFALALVGLGLSSIVGRRDRPGYCAHDPHEEHTPGQVGCSVCGGDADKCCQNQE